MPAKSCFSLIVNSGWRGGVYLPEHPPRDCHHPYDDRRHHGDIKHDLKTSQKNTHTLRETNRASKFTTTAGLSAAAALLVLEQPHKLHLNIKEFQKFSQLVSFKQPTTVILRARRKVTPAPPTTCRQLFLELCSTMYKMCTVLRKMSFAHQHPRKVRFCRTPRICSI